MQNKDTIKMNTNVSLCTARAPGHPNLVCWNTAETRSNAKTHTHRHTRASHKSTICSLQLVAWDSQWTHPLTNTDQRGRETNQTGAWCVWVPQSEQARVLFDKWCHRNSARRKKRVQTLLSRRVISVRTHTKTHTDLGLPCCGEVIG